MVVLQLLCPDIPLQEVLLEGKNVQQEVLPWVVDEMRQVVAQELPVDEICGLKGAFVQEIFEDRRSLVFDDCIRGKIRFAKTWALRKLTP